MEPIPPFFPVFPRVPGSVRGPRWSLPPPGPRAHRGGPRSDPGGGAAQWPRLGVRGGDLAGGQRDALVKEFSGGDAIWNSLRGHSQNSMEFFFLFGGNPSNMYVFFFFSRMWWYFNFMVV